MYKWILTFLICFQINLCAGDNEEKEIKEALLKKSSKQQLKSLVINSNRPKTLYKSSGFEDDDARLSQDFAGEVLSDEAKIVSKIVNKKFEKRVNDYYDGKERSCDECLGTCDRYGSDLLNVMAIVFGTGTIVFMGLEAGVLGEGGKLVGAVGKWILGFATPTCTTLATWLRQAGREHDPEFSRFKQIRNVVLAKYSTNSKKKKESDLSDISIDTSKKQNKKKIQLTEESDNEDSSEQDS